MEGDVNPGSPPNQLVELPRKAQGYHRAERTAGWHIGTWVRPIHTVTGSALRPAVGQAPSRTLGTS